MTRQAKTIEDIQHMADEIAQLIAARFGGARPGEHPTLQEMLRRRGGALPWRMRRRARYLAQADRLCGQPRVGRQQDMRRISRAYGALFVHLRPLGPLARMPTRTVQITATVAFGLLLLATIVIWLMEWRGMP